MELRVCSHGGAAALSLGYGVRGLEPARKVDSMIESPRIFRPEFPEERRVPRVVGIDDVAVAHRGLRVISCRELSSSLRRCIFVARQSIVDAQRKNGSFCRVAPDEIAECMLTAFWLGLDEDPTLQGTFVECVDVLLESQLPCGQWVTGFARSHATDPTLLVYLALKLFGVAPHDERMISARHWILKQGGLACAPPIARGYLALFGQAPFEPDLDELGSLRHGAEDNAWRRLLQRRVHRQLVPADALLELRSCQQHSGRSGIWVSVIKQWRDGFRAIRSRMASTFDRFGGRRVDFACPTENSPRSICYQTMASEDPGSGMQRSEQLQNLFEQLKDPFDGLDSLASVDVTLQARCLEAMLLSGMPVTSPAVVRATHLLRQASLTHSHSDQTALLRIACLMRGAEWENEFFPPPLQVASPRSRSSTDVEPQQEVEHLVSDIPRYLAAVRARQQRTGDWEGCPLATAHAISALSTAGVDLGCPKMAAAIRFLRRTQRKDGSWQAMHGDRVVSTTASVVAASRHAGIAPQDPLIERGVSFLRSTQQANGGWIEKRFSAGREEMESTVSLEVTGCVLSALIESGFASSAEVALGIDFLLESALFDPDSKIDTDGRVSLIDACTVLGTLCRWASFENNGESREKSMAISATRLSIHEH